MQKLKHLAIIPDGNRRWAKENGFISSKGHTAGYNKVKEISLSAFEKGIEEISVWVFSTENWKRTEKEVSFLMDLLFTALSKELDFYLKNNIQLKVIGRKDGLSSKIIKAIKNAEEKTKGCTKGRFNLLINYGGRAEIIDAVKQMTTEGVDLGSITEEEFSKHLWTNSSLAPDMIVRTSGEKRLSGFMSWSGVYSELRFVDKHWPDFSESDIDDCIQDFNGRQRRHGA
jgi:undecaprenyl diphosphate synthase